MLHSDLRRDHLLRDSGGGLAALLDFGDAFVGSLAWDFALLHWYYGKANTGLVTASYPEGEVLDCRGRHLAVRSIGKRAGLGAVHPHMLRAAFIMAALDADVPLRDVQIAARHADPRTTTIDDRRRQNFDRHAAYVWLPSSPVAEGRSPDFVIRYLARGGLPLCP